MRRLHLPLLVSLTCLPALLVAVNLHAQDEPPAAADPEHAEVSDEQDAPHGDGDAVTVSRNTSISGFSEPSTGDAENHCGLVVVACFALRKASDFITHDLQQSFQIYTIIEDQRAD